MKRPFILIGGALLTASFLLPLLGGGFSAAVLILALILAFCIMPKDRRLAERLTVIAIILLLSVLRFVSLDLYISYKNHRLANSDAVIEAIVTEVEFSGDVSRFSLSIKDSDEKEAKGIKAAGYMFGAVDFRQGDKITADVTFTENDDRYKAADFDGGEYFSVKVEDYFISKHSADPLLSFADKVRTDILRAANSLVADEKADLLGAVLIGDKHSIGVDLNDYVKDTGTSHLLVVSGMHLGILCGLLMRLLKTRISRWLTVVLMFFFVLFLAVICLFHISVLRAGIAYIIMLIGMLIRRDSDSLSSLGMATSFLTLCFPYLFYNVAFMLSVSATYAVIGPANTLLKTFYFWGKRSSLPKRAVRYLFETVVVAVCALVFTLPFTVYYFGSSCLIAPVSNLLLSFSVTGMLAAGMLGVLIWFIPAAGKPLSIPFIFVARLFAAYFIFTVRLIAKSGIGFIDVDPDKAVYFGIFAVIFMLAVYFICKHINSKKEIRPFAYRQDPEILS